MANIPVIEAESIQVGRAPVAPIAAVDLWPSLDPTVPFTLQSTGINNFPALTNQLGLYNGVGLWSQLGLGNLLGFGVDTGGHADAQPDLVSAAKNITFTAITGNLYGAWFYENQPICAPCPSDITLKKNITPLKNSLDKVINLQGVSFDWNEKIYPQKVIVDCKSEVGLIAQEVEKIIPELVVEFETKVLDENDEFASKKVKGIKYENLTALLIEAIKEQQEQINSLKQTVQELSTKLENCCP